MRGGLSSQLSLYQGSYIRQTRSHCVVVPHGIQHVDASLVEEVLELPAGEDFDETVRKGTRIYGIESLV